jgi:predicted HD phosphohydrolase
MNIMSPGPNTRPDESYHKMEDGSKEEYMLLRELAKPFKEKKVERILQHFEGLHNSFPGMAVSRYVHCLQTATQAHKAGESEEYVVAALMHDIGDLLSPDNHGPVAAELLKPYVSEKIYWMITYHNLFQGYFFFHHYGKDRNMRDRFKGHPCYQMTVDFCGKYDQTAFDPNMDTMPLEAFKPMIARIFNREPWGDHTKAEQYSGGGY